ncbi:YggT family protein [Streptococcus sp. sy004]|uniref:YggT family protein n=2 Tax=Streptococcus TaxID=1301 RepID=UPI0011B5F323|nr:YggT family protein [Streptococcus sp. sy004]TWT12191.1 YggT family protein [Streptococcus sp. sy004]
MVLVILVSLRLIQVYSYILFIYAIMSWFPGAYETKLGQIIVGLVEPLLTPFKKFRLVFAGLDFTIFLVMFLLNRLSAFLISLL